MAGPVQNVQILRGVACLAVVCYHLALAEREIGIGFRPLQPFCWFGMAGVDLFFVISGFIIARSTGPIAGDVRRVPTFLARRAVRVLVPFWVWLLAFDLPVDLYSTPRPYTPELLGPFFRCVFLAGPGEIPRWVPQSWSLTYEAAFYVAVAAILCLPRRIGTAAWVTWAVAVVVHRVTLVPAPTAWTNLWFGPFPLEFLDGVAVAKLADRWSGKAAATSAVAALAWGFGVFAVAGSLTGGELYVPETVRVLMFGPFAAALVLLAVTAERAGFVATNRFGLALGNAS